MYLNKWQLCVDLFFRNFFISYVHENILFTLNCIEHMRVCVSVLYPHTQYRHVFIVVSVKCYYCSVIRIHSLALGRSRPFSPSHFHSYTHSFTHSLISVTVTAAATATHFGIHFIQFNTSGDNACINIDWALFTNL